MISSKNIERQEHSAVKLSVIVPQTEVRKAYDALLMEYSRTMRIDGFRKGHVPAKVLLRKFGGELKTEAMSRVLEAAVEEALADAEEKPLGYSVPTLDGQPDFDLDKDFSFAVTFDVFPEAKIADRKGLEIELPGPKSRRRMRIASLPRSASATPSSWKRTIPPLRPRAMS